ncbi:MAG: IS4 family transposase [Anaerolineales bacterium]|nr:IS4 family transposase [Anaerolineales bacterium]
MKKSSSVRHARAIQRDRSKHSPAAPPDEEVKARLTEIIHPATLNQVAHFHQLGLRERTLTLPIMVGLVLSMIWRQIGGVCDLVRVVQTEVVLWVPPLKVSQQALTARLTSLPAELFQGVWQQVLPELHRAWQQRERPLPPEIAWAQARYRQVAVCDGSTLDALMRKTGLLKDLEQHPLAGKMTALLDLCSRLPVQIWYEADAQTHDQQFWDRIVGALCAGALLVFDLGYTNFSVFARLTREQVTFITRAKKNLRFTVDQVLCRTANVHDQTVWIGQGDDRQLVRLLEVLYRGTWYRYLTNELDPVQLPAAYVVTLYWQRWRIEDAYNIVKRLLGLAYFWCGAQNAVELQRWATWLLYAVLVDLTVQVAEALRQPFAAISMEMVYRSLYFFAQAYHRGETTDIAAYFATHAKLFGLVKHKRPSKNRSPLPLPPLTIPGMA